MTTKTKKYHFIPHPDGGFTKKHSLKLTAIEQEFVRNTKNLDPLKPEEKAMFQTHLQKMFKDYEYLTTPTKGN